MARSATIRLNVQLADGVAEVQRLETSLEEVGVAGLEAADNIERGASDSRAALLSQAQAAERASQATRSMGRGASNTATQLGFELTQAAQDAQFGMAGVANQIPLMAEQFQRLQRESGSTTGAMRKLMGTFFGGTGLIALGTLLPTLLPTVLNFFNSASDAASNLEERTSEALDSILEFEEIEGQRRIPREQLPDAIRQQEQRIEALRTLREEAGTALRAAEGIGFENLEPILQALPGVEVTDQLRDAISLMEDRFETEELTTEQINQTVTAQEQLLSRLEERKRELTDIRRLREDIEAIGGEPTDGETTPLGQQLAAIEQRIGMQLGDPGVQRQDIQHGLGPRQSIAATRTDAVLGRTTANVARQMPSQQQLQNRVIQARMKLFKEMQEAASKTRTAMKAANIAVDAMSGAAVNFATALIDGRNAAAQLPNIFREVAKQLTRIAVRKGIVAILNIASGGIGSLFSSGTEAFTGTVDPGISGEDILGNATAASTQSNLNTGARVTADTRASQVTSEIRALRGDVRTLQVNMSASEAEGSINEVQQEDRRMGASIYSQTT